MVTTAAPAPPAVPTRQGVVRRAVLGLAPVALFMVPVNFAVVPGPLTLAFFSAVALVACVGVHRALRRHLTSCLFLGLVLVCIVVLHGFSVPLAYVVAYLAAGYAIGSAAAWRWTVTGLWVVLVASLSLEALLQAHAYLDLFPAQRFSTTVGGPFRARGVVGQAVPAAMLVVLTTTMVVILTRTLPRRLLVLGVGALALVATGTRSSLLVVGVLLVVLLVRMVCVRSSGSRRSGLVALTVAAAVGAAVLSSSRTGRTRLLDFDGLAGTDSLVVRSEGLNVIRALDSSCGAICLVFGNGPTALQAQLNQGAAVRGLSTLDNYYLDAWWNFGLIGILLLVSLFVVALRLVLTTEDETTLCGAAGLIVLLVGALFYSAFYLTAPTIALGVVIALALRPRDRTPHGTTDDDAAASTDRVRGHLQLRR